MPWRIEKSNACGSSKPFAVVKNADDSLVACHATEASAKAQLAALYASEAGRSAAVEVEKRFLTSGDHAPVVSRCMECGGTCGGKNKDHKPGPAKIVGYAATFGTRSQNLGGFVESIRPGAFKSVLKRAASGDPQHDVVALWNHDPNLLLGRLSAGTLKLSEDERGLRYEITPPEWARGYVESVERGDVTGSSFSFSVDKRNEQWAPGENGGAPLRSISSVDRLVDVGPVVFPAYLSTESKVARRCIEIARTYGGTGKTWTPAPATLARARAAIKRNRQFRNCGTGSGGFQPGNTCAKGGDGESDGEGSQAEHFSDKPGNTFQDKHPYDPETIARVKGQFKETDEMYRRPDGSYTPDRTKLHDKIMDHFLSPDVKPPVGRAPIFHVLGGGPAAGKSTMLDTGNIVPGVPGKDYILVAPDDIKDFLPEYNSLKVAGFRGAATFAHEESSAISKKIMNEAMSRRLDIVLDGTGDGSLDNLKGKIEKARAAGYQVYGHYASNSFDNALKSSDYRFKTQGRVIDDKTVLDTHASVSRVFPEAVKQGLFDKADLYDTNIRGTARHVLSYEKGGEAKILDGKLWQDFLDKGKGYSPSMIRQ